MNTKNAALDHKNNRIYALKKLLIKYKFIHLLVLPGIIQIIIFQYIPIGGLIVAFKNYKGIGGVAGILNSEWVGFKHFIDFFSGEYFWRLLGNTLIISVYRLIFGFPAPIILALLLNEIHNQKFKKIVQTITYLPHFLSWVVISGLVMALLSADGPVNQFISMLGMNNISFLSNSKYFRSVLVTSSIWKETGWGAIVYLAAISGIPNELYESATVEGASRWQKTIYITIPSITFIIVILFILRVGSVIDQNFEQIFNLYNPAVYRVADVFETFVYRRGLDRAEFSYAAAVGIFKSVTSLVLVVVTNKAAKKVGQEGIW